MKKKKIKYTVMAVFLLCMCIFAMFAVHRKKTIHENLAVAEEINRELRGELWVHLGELSDEISPLGTEKAGDENVLALCYERPKVTVLGQSEGILKVELSAAGNGVTASGEKITADDLLFNLYLRIDPSNGSLHDLGDLVIAGEKEFLFGQTDLIAAEKEMIKQRENPSGKLSLLFRENVVRPVLTREWRWVNQIFGTKQYAGLVKQYRTPKELFAHFFSYNTEYSAEKRTEEQVLEDVIMQYGGNLNALAKVTGEDYTEVKNAYTLTSWQQMGKSLVHRIKGIKKLDEKRVLLEVTSGKESLEALKKMWILPLSVYGQKEKFDAVGQFGFERGNTEEIYQKASVKMKGSGSFYLEKKEKKFIVLKRSPYAPQGKNRVQSIKVLKKTFAAQKEMLKELNSRKLDLAVTEDSAVLNRLLLQKKDGTVYHVRKKGLWKGDENTCFVYRTSYLNATSFPKSVKDSQDFFCQFGKIKVNTK